MKGPMTWLRLGSLMAAGAFGVHQLRYLLAYRDGAEHALAHSGHAYLVALEPLIAVALAFLLGSALVRVAGGRPGRPLPSRRSLSLVFGGALLAAYIGQEVIEGQVAAGHAVGIAGAFDGGGWLAVPLSFAIGFGMSLCVHAAEAAAEHVRLAGILLPTHRSTPQLSVRFASRPSSCRAALARHLAGRGPPSPLAH
jgi:hypothetical protein